MAMREEAPMTLADIAGQILTTLLAIQSELEDLNQRVDAVNQNLIIIQKGQ